MSRGKANFFGRSPTRVGFGGPVRGNAADRGYDGDWQRLRRDFAQRHPLCVNWDRCRGGCEIVDHITPIAAGGARLDEDNLQPMCRPCHAQKSEADRARYPWIYPDRGRGVPKK